MNEFQIFTAEQIPVAITEEIIPEYGKYKMINSHPYSAKGNFGAMLFQHFTGKEFAIWYSNYFLKKASAFIRIVDMPVIELQIPVLNEFESSCNGMDHIRMREHQFEITYAPFVRNFAKFEGGKHYQKFDIHFTTQILEPYAVSCRKLADFLDNVIKERPANLLDMVQYIDLDMYRIIHSILQYDKQESLATNYFSALTHELLTLLVIHVAALTDKTRFSHREIQQGEEARKIMLDDFENNYTITELAKMTGLNELKLQMVFKHLYGTTIYKFSKQARLAHAYKLLQTTNYPLRIICTMVGYSDAPNFFVAFKNQYGFAPGKFQKRGKE